MDIDKMEAGPELDQKVEELVMGRVPCDSWTRSYGGAGLALMGLGRKDVGFFYKGEVACGVVIPDLIENVA